MTIELTIYASTGKIKSTPEFKMKLFESLFH